jgi:prefoldin subunit 5
LKATLDDPNTIFLNVGAHVNVKKSLPDVITLLDEQSVAIEKNYVELQTQFENLFHEATTINEQIAPLVTK